jgi:two-component system, NtrC family, nitrogen regulation sensor histidine kinase NtrY
MATRPGSSPSLRPGASAQAPPRPRRPFRDNPLQVLLGIFALVVALAGMMLLLSRSSQLAPDFLSEFVLYALSVVDLTMLVGLVFVLARSVIKMLVERQQGLPFARFRAKLVLLLLGMTLIPALLVLLVGSQLIFNSVDRWFNQPMDEMLDSSQRIASDYYHERQRQVTDETARLARGLATTDLSTSDLRVVRDAVAGSVTDQRLTLVEVYRLVPGADGLPQPLPVVDVAAAAAAPVTTRDTSERLAARAAGGQPDPWMREPLDSGGELIRAAAVVHAAAGSATGVVVGSVQLTGEMAARARRMTKAYESYTQLRVFKPALTGVYLSFFLMVTLMILVSATWMGLYLAKRITRPVQRLAAAAREIGAGHFEHRVERETADEFGSLVDAFNTMADELAASRRALEQSSVDLQRKHAEVEDRRRFTEAVLDRVATGVITIDAGGRIGILNPAAARLLGLDAGAVGRPAEDAFGSGDLKPLADLATAPYAAGRAWPAQEIVLTRDGREVQLALAATPLHGDGRQIEGRVLVLDDITPLIRAQKVAAWREVARRLAHEIKNPLTPIQLCAQRLQRQFSAAPEPVRQLVDECTGTIVGEVEALKTLVDEFSQFARMPSPRRVPTDLHQLLAGTLGLYEGLFAQVRIEPLFAVSVPLVRLDPDQIRRVVINLVDNAIEALNQRGLIVVETQHDAAAGVARIIVADDGPGIAAEERDKLFMPYYSTKKRGSGLGLAIVRRIVAEHGGSVEVGGNEPRGTRFTIELPCGDVDVPPGTENT